MADGQFPASVKEAQDHIRKIRSDKGLGDGPDQVGNNASDLESALRILSDDLYRTATHFLLELIQNADDNTYSAHEPTISITYSPNQVRIDCNEDGFTFRNVEAICRICNSTKSGRSKSSGFVGEKGIGFKAVFKAAHTVWIKSGHYSFKFDRDAHLGMIAPVWHQFPGQTKKGWTSILLDLTDNCDQTAIINELRSYDSRLLLFLRRLRKLVVKVDFGRFRPGGFTKSLGRGDWPATNPAMITLRTDRKQNDYFVWKQRVDNLPNEGRRQGISSSEVVLAFPLQNNMTKPLLEAQNVYAFLPIRDCGFKFLLQGDFLLPANREDVTADSAWNKALISAASNAFVDAMVHMAHLKTQLRYTLVRFVPNQMSQSPIFEDFRDQVMEKLRKAAILETQYGTLQPPDVMTFIPKEFCDETGCPFVLTPENSRKILSENYHVDDQSYMMDLDLKVMDQEAFVSQTKVLLNSNPAKFFKDRSKSWHASFCQSLTSLSAQTRLTMAIIPVRSGAWVTASNGPIFFPKDDMADSVIPEGINVKVVDREAANDSNRRNLFTLMGVREYQNTDISNIIIGTHKSTLFKPATLSPEVLVSHAVFLFKAGWENKTNENIWMAAKSGPSLQAFSMYMPSNEPSSANQVLPKGETYGILHQAYSQQNNQRYDDWLKFLKKELKIAVYPRIMNPSPIFNASSPNYIHPDFVSLMKGTLTEQSLVVLRDGWEYYKQFLDRNSVEAAAFGFNGQQQNLIDFLRTIPAKCIGMTEFIPIKNTFISLPKMVETGEGLAPLLSIPEPEHPDWIKPLGCLHVTLEDDVRFYLECLRGASKRLDTTMDTVCKFMLEIELKGGNKLVLLREAFKKEKLIYVPAKTKQLVSKWMTTEECFWRGESWLKHSVGLQALYPDNEILFRNYLRVPNSRLEHLVKEAEGIRLGHKNSHIARIFSAISNHLVNEEMTEEQRERLRSHPMFPIVTKPDKEPYEYLASASDARPWLIADRAVFWTSFQYILPVLGMSVETVLKINNFIIALRLGERLLSKKATCVTEAHGNVEQSDELTERYRARTDYLLRLVPKAQVAKEPMVRNFRSVEVHIASKIVQYWRAPVGLTQVQSTLSDGVAFIECDYKGQLRVYFRQGYETEANACELAEKLRQFFNISVENRDLLNVILTDRIERVEELFEIRGIPPLPENVVKETHGEDSEVDDFDPVENSEPPPEEDSASRFSRLLRRMRFIPVRPTDNGDYVTQDEKDVIREPGINKPPVVQAPIIPTVRSTMMQLKLSQDQDSIVGTAPELSFLDKIKGLAQFDNDIGEMIVSDILEEVLGNQYDPKGMWRRGTSKSADVAPFVFTDYQGRFTALLSQLAGVSGRSQGYGNLIYHIDVKTTRSSSPGKLKLRKSELDRARQYSTLQAYDAELSRSVYRNVSVVAYISNVRSNPSIMFLTDTWDLINQGQLQMNQQAECKLSLNLRPRSEEQSHSKSVEPVGLDVVQFKPIGGPPLGKS